MVAEIKNNNQSDFNKKEIATHIKSHQLEKQYLATSLSQFYNAAENALSGISLLDKNFNFLYLNPLAAQNRNCGRNIEITSRNFFDFLKKDSQEKILKEIKAGYFKGEIEIANNKKQKILQTIIIEVPPLQDKSCFLAIENDITERKKLEQELKNTQERLKILFEEAPDTYYLHDLKGNFIDGNKATEELTGYKREELIGKNFFKIKLLTFNQIPKAAALLAKNALGQPTGPDQFTLLKKDGAEVNVEIRSTPVKIQGQTLVLGIARDITERKKFEEKIKESEEKYRLLFEASADGILIADIETKKFKFANSAICKMLGYTEEELKTMGVNDIHPKDKLKYVISEFEAQAKKEKILAEKIPCLRKDGSIFYADINTTQITLKGHRSNVGLFRDITERKKAEEEIKQKNKDLERFNKLSVDRELKMIELKNEILKLKK